MEESGFKKMHPIDEISNLPDCLLHRILSLLETKESVCTSVLSKRWINVWKSVPRLDLRTSDFEQLGDFVNFANSIIHHKLFPNPEQLDQFSLKWRAFRTEAIDKEMVQRWIYDLVSLKPTMVHVEVPDLGEKYFFECLFNCPTMDYLFFWPQYDWGWEAFNPDNINLPLMDRLHIGGLPLENAFIQKLISACPVLIYLVFESCNFNGTERISSNILQRLRIWRPHFTENTILRVSTPSLLRLESEAPLGHISFENLKSLEFASVTLTDMKNDYYDREDVKLLSGLSNAKTINLSGTCVEHMLNKEAADLSVFERLESLWLDSFSIYTDLHPISYFLRRSPNLEKLTLRSISIKESLMMTWGAPSEIQCDKLKTVEIVCSRNDGQMHELVKCLLLHLKTIQNVFISRIDDVFIESDDDDAVIDGGDDSDDAIILAYSP